MYIYLCKRYDEFNKNKRFSEGMDPFELIFGWTAIFYHIWIIILLDVLFHFFHDHKTNVDLEQE